MQELSRRAGRRSYRGVYIPRANGFGLTEFHSFARRIELELFPTEGSCSAFFCQTAQERFFPCAPSAENGPHCSSSSRQRESSVECFFCEDKGLLPRSLAPRKPKTKGSFHEVLLPGKSRKNPTLHCRSPYTIDHPYTVLCVCDFVVLVYETIVL